MAGTISPYATAAGKRYRVRYRKADQTQTDKRGFKTKREAEVFLASVTVTKATGDYIDPARGRVTIGTLGSSWLAVKRGKKASYYSTLERDWRVYVEPRWGTVPVSKVLPSDVAAWLQDLSDGTAPTNRSESTHNPDGPRSASVVLRCLGILRGILAMAVADGRLAKNPAAGIADQPRKHSTKPRRYLSDADIGRLVTAIDDPTRSTLVLFLAYTGLRWGEAAALRARDINLLRRRAHVRENVVEVEGKIDVTAAKNWEKRTVPFPTFLSKPLEKLIGDRGPDAIVFAGTLDGYMRRPKTDEDSKSWFRVGTTAAGLERLTIHDLRHTAASLAVASGANVKVVQRMLGHKSAAMTLDTYADLFDGDLDDVAERMGSRGQTHAEAALTAVGIST